MDKLIQRLNEEMSSWVGDLVTNSDLSSEKLLKRYSYEYCIKEEIINYFQRILYQMTLKSSYWIKKIHCLICTLSIWKMIQQIFITR